MWKWPTPKPARLETLNINIIAFMKAPVHFRSLCLLAVLGVAVSGQPQDSVAQQLSTILQRIQSGDLSTARSELERMVAQTPTDARVLNLLGVVNARENNISAAESEFQKAIKASPRFSGAYLNLGRLLQEHSDRPQALQRALAVYTKLLEFEPDNVEANYQAAWVANCLGSFDASLHHLDRLPATAQTRAPALAVRCADYAGLGRSVEAQKTATELVAAPDLSESDILPMLSTLVQHGSEEVAAELLEALAARGLASPDSLRRQAALEENRGNFKQARAALETDLKLESPSVPLLTQLARVAYRASDLEGALGYLAHARDMAPENAGIHFFFGVICIDLRLPPEAKESLQTAVRLDPGNPYYNYALGAVLVGQRNPDGAIPYLQKFVDSKPTDPRGHFALGVAYFDANQPAMARKELSAIADRPETQYGAYLYLGRLDIEDEHYDQALNHLRKAIEGNPEVPDAYAESALVHIRRNEYPAAEQDLAQALKLAPDHYLSNLRLLMLYRRTNNPQAAAQTERVERLQKTGEQKEQLLMRSLEIRPY
jgi:tetratricopeptide (TPR) repeat protein